MGPSAWPISKALIRPRDLFRLLAIGMCHFLPVYHLGIIFLGRVEGQNITVPVMLEVWGMRNTPSLPSLSGPLWLGVVSPDRVLSMGQIELNCVLMLNWIAWNRNVLIFKLRTYAKLNCLKWNCFCMLNWIVWNRSFWLCNCTYAKLNCLKLCLYQSELYEL